MWISAVVLKRPTHAPQGPELGLAQVARLQIALTKPRSAGGSLSMPFLIFYVPPKESEVSERAGCMSCNLSVHWHGEITACDPNYMFPFPAWLKVVKNQP